MENGRYFIDLQVNLLAESMNLEVVNMKNNNPPNGCILLEQLFDRHDIYKGKIPKQQTYKVLEFNIGTEINPRMVKIGEGITEEERHEILNLNREFKDAFS